MECNNCKYQMEDETCGAFECNGLECPELPCEINPKDCIKVSKLEVKCHKCGLVTWNITYRDIKSLRKQLKERPAYCSCCGYKLEV